MPSSISNSASTTVFSFPELREIIIGFVPERYILTHIQMLSRNWNASVASFGIQKLLWTSKGKKPAKTPVHFTQRDLGIPVYKMPIATNIVLGNACRLHQDYRMSYSVLQSGAGHAEHDFYVRSVASKTNREVRPVFLDCSDLSWYSMQVCSPPITTARLRTHSGEEIQGDEPQNHDSIYVSTTIHDKEGITMGLVYDTAAATLRPNIGDARKDPNLGWHFFLTYGIEVDCGDTRSLELHGNYGSNGKLLTRE